MLTRDIELGDALLDLLDNCLDGVLRSVGAERAGEHPYKGFHATMSMSDAGFVIEDNCGGIRLETAKKYAFAMGRPKGAEDDTPATIGMYGIGMKRAIFKLGQNAIVQSRHDGEEGFFVEFTPEWMEADSWDDLTVHPLERRETSGTGTRIEVLELGEEAKRFFSSPEKIDEFRKLVAQHYSLILAKGFEVRIGTPEELASGKGLIKPESFRLLASATGADGIAPFVYKGEVDGVSCEIYAGLYRPLLSQEELDTEEERRGSSDDSGWIVACNDRVVIWKDKTRLTGWGEAGVPNFHGQFIPITGIALLYAQDPRLLPLTTTKRGIDGASNVYSQVKDMMREATKELTRFTNRWKKFPDKRNTMYDESRRVTLAEIREHVRTDVIPLRATRRFREIRVFQPNLPAPAREETDARISFLASKSEIAIVARHFFEEPKVKNEDVGKQSFALALRVAKGAAE
ncbi:MAG: ATP-binding protein [Wenzhouxiangella sp.]